MAILDTAPERRPSGRTNSRARKILKVLRIALIVLAIAAIAAAGGADWYFHRSLPRTTGTERAAGLLAPLRIVRDIDDVPHIYARNAHDARFGLGYVHAQDRLWQMEFQRRIGQGRLSEIFGAATVPQDRFLRILGVYRVAEQDWPAYPAPAKAEIQAYVDGINAFLSTHHGADLPPEFTLLRCAPKPWTGPDVLVWQKMMSWNLSGNFGTELLRDDIARQVGTARARDLMSGYPANMPAIPPPARSAALPDAGLLAAAQSVRALIGASNATGLGLGSNNWVVDGTKSASGKPILANDPHLGTGMPGVWYAAHISGGDLDAIGGTIPGLPAIVIGRNESIAWGVTSLCPDTQDLYREDLDPSGRLARFRGRMEPVRSIREVIKVKGGPDTVLMVRATRHGPLLSDALNAFSETMPPKERDPERAPLALRWTALDPGDTTVAAFLSIDRARNWDTFRGAMRQYVTPSQNFVYADMAGHIGYFGPGKLPIRAHGNGAFPIDGASGENEWTGWIPFDALPQAFDPPAHLVVTANNKPVPDSYRYYLGDDWQPGYRARRITELLTAKAKLSAEDNAAIQADTLSLQAAELLPKMLALATPHTDDDRQAAALLRSWNHVMSGGSAAAAIYAAWVRRLPRAIAGDELGPRLTKNYEGAFAFTSRFLARTLDDPGSPWFDDIRTNGREDGRSVLTATLHDAVAEVKNRLGSDMRHWRWDRLHTVVFAHQPFDHVGPLRKFFNREIGQGGDESTVDSGAFASDGTYEQKFGAMYRQVIDLANADSGRFILAAGESGHFLSPHYDDYLQDWRAARLRPMRFTRDAVRKAASGTLTLIP